MDEETLSLVDVLNSKVEEMVEKKFREIRLDAYESIIKNRILANLFVDGAGMDFSILFRFEENLSKLTNYIELTNKIKSDIREKIWDKITNKLISEDDLLKQDIL
jgi:hypothetical protein